MYHWTLQSGALCYLERGGGQIKKKLSNYALMKMREYISIRFCTKNNEKKNKKTNFCQK